MQDAVEVAQTVYDIPAENYAAFVEKIAKLSKRSVKLTGKPIKPEIVGRFKRKAQTMAERKVAGLDELLIYQVVMPFEPVKLAGWVFAARLDHSNMGGNIIRLMPRTNFEIPEAYRTSEPFCDHCAVKRRRKDTFLVCEEATGTFKQIGTKCLADFLGHDPSVALRIAQFIDSAADEAEGMGQGRGDYRIEVERFLAHTALAIRLWGWTSVAASQASENLESTRSKALNNMYPPRVKGVQQKGEDLTEGDVAVAAASIAWAKALADKRSLSEYEHNISVLASQDVVEDRSLGLLASVVSGYLRDQDKLKKRELEKKGTLMSTHVGEIGDRIEFGRVTVIGAYRREHDFGFGMIYKFRTETGAILTWFASSGKDIMQGQTIELKGSVKKHDTYNNEKQTIVTRCSVTEIKQVETTNA